MNQRAEIASLFEKQANGAVEVSVRFSHEKEAQRIAHWLGSTTLNQINQSQLVKQLEALPPTVRATWLTNEGVLSETRSALGDWPLWLFIRDENEDQE